MERKIQVSTKLGSGELIEMHLQEMPPAYRTLTVAVCQYQN